MKKRILAAVDLGFDSGWERRARLTIDQALWLGKSLGLGVDLVHVADTASAAGSQKGAVALLTRFIEEQKARFKEFSKQASVVPLFMKGDPVAKLIQLAGKRAQYECLVLSTHGRTGIARMLVGSVAEEVIRNSKIPVVCIGAQARQSQPGGVVFVATDLGVNSHKTEKLALDWASRLKASGVLFHSLREGLHPVLQTAYASGPASAEVQGLIQPHRDRALKGLELRRKAWARKKLSCEVILDEKHASAESGILEAIASRPVSIAFLGTHGRTLAGRVFLGSTAREVVLGGSIPVVTVKS